MSWYRNLKIGSKLLVAFALVLLLTGFVGGFALLQMSQVRKSASEIATVCSRAYASSAKCAIH